MGYCSDIVIGFPIDEGKQIDLEDEKALKIIDALKKDEIYLIQYEEDSFTNNFSVTSFMFGFYLSDETDMEKINEKRIKLQEHKLLHSLLQQCDVSRHDVQDIRIRSYGFHS